MAGSRRARSPIPFPAEHGWGKGERLTSRDEAVLVLWRFVDALGAMSEGDRSYVIRRVTADVPELWMHDSGRAR